LPGRADALLTWAFRTPGTADLTADGGR